jgi:hypothetical protein
MQIAINPATRIDSKTQTTYSRPGSNPRIEKWRAAPRPAIINFSYSRGQLYVGIIDPFYSERMSASKTSK